MKDAESFKPMMQNFDEKTLRSFLLGTLAETTQITVEDAIFADADLRAEAENVENDLIDEYTRGELSPTEKSSFEKMFFNSAERIQKIEFANAFNNLPSQGKFVAEPAKISAKENFWDKIRVFFLKSQIAFAVVLLIFLILGSLFLLTRPTNEPQIARGNENRNTNLEITPTVSPSATNPINNSQINAPVTNKPNINKHIENKAVTPTPLPEKTPVETAPAFATLIFPAGALRDGGKKFVLNLPKNARQANLVFNLEKGDEFPAYQIEIKSRSGEPIMKAKVSRRNRQIALAVPINKFANTFYTATVRSLAADGTGETLGYYDFQVIKP